jgi:uncharacterized cupredoxin-like copper-binding protein/Cu/Ag efflux protein CusF
MLRVLLFAVFALLVSSVAPLYAGAAAPMVEGEIRKVDLEEQRITIKHGPLPHLNMDMDMTMVFRVTDAALLDGLAEGDRIWFRAERIEGAFTVTAIGDGPDAADAGHDHGDAGEEVLAHDSGREGGKPGSADDVDRTIMVDAADIEFNTAQIDVRDGETIRFIVTNTGEIEHEFNIGTAEMHAAHQEEMMAMMDAMVEGEEMQHAHGNSVFLQPGETREFVWTFAHAHDLQFACNVPGHYDAGMVGNINFVH